MYLRHCHSITKTRKPCLHQSSEPAEDWLETLILKSPPQELETIFASLSMGKVIERYDPEQLELYTNVE